MLSLGAGAIFSLFTGVIVVWTGASLGLLLAFLIGRRVTTPGSYEEQQDLAVALQCRVPCLEYLSLQTLITRQ